MARKLRLAAVAAVLVPAISATPLFTPTKDACKAQSANGCAAKAAAKDRLEKGNGRTKVGTVSPGTLNCVELYDHETTWTVTLSETETIVAEKTTFVKGYDDFVTWCGSIVGEAGGQLCISWKIGHKCSASNFHMLATRGDSGTGISRNFETQPGTPVRRRLQDGTEVVTDDNLTVIEVFREYVDEEDAEARRRLAENSLAVPEVEYLPDGRKASAVDYCLQQVQNWKDGRTQADMFLRHGNGHLRGNTLIATSGEHRELATLDNGSNIDIMVLFTANAATLAGGEAALRSALATAYGMFASMMKNSNIAISFTVVALYKTSYVESTSGLTADLSALQAGLYLSTGESVSSVRTKIGADLVQMVMNGVQTYCGLGAIFTPTDTSAWGPYAFSVVNYFCLDNYSHLHEIGHNVGMNHDLGNAVSEFGYGYGYKYCVTGGYRTLMSYACTSGTSVGRAPVLSSPSVAYMNRPSGTATADNRRVLMTTALRISNFYLSTGVTTTTTTPIPTTVKTPTPTPTPKPVPAPVTAPISSTCKAQPYDQCGGQNWTGATCCPSGYYCKVSNIWWSDCQMGTAPTPAPTPKVATPTSTPTVKIPTPSPTPLVKTGCDAFAEVVPSPAMSIYSGEASALAIQYEGCYNDNGKTSDVGRAFAIMKDLTPAKCAAYCAVEGFQIMALQSGEQCSCGNTYGAQGADSSNLGCKTACSGSMDLTCGGNKKNAVYAITGSPDGYTYMGCYKDDASARAFEVAPKTFTMANSPQLCAEECTDYNYFGLQAGNQCVCGNSGVMRYGAATGCTTPCVGDSSKMCGGALVNTVYSQRNSGAMTFKGCFQDNASNPDLVGPTKALQSFSTPQTCYSYCKGLHFTVFGLQNGDICNCGNSFGSYGISALSACDMSCPGDSTVPCGGQTTNSVYQINY